MDDQRITPSQLEALITKLNAMDFTDEERSILQAIFEAASGAEVAGFDFSMMGNLGSLQIFSKVPTPPTTDSGSSHRHREEIE